MQSLFPMSNGPRRASPPEPSAPLLSIKAGKCAMVPEPDGKFYVTADVRRGKIVLIRASDGLLHFRWENRVNNDIEDDRIIFPGDATFKKVKTGRANDRVYILSFQSRQKFMYWFQDLNDSKDDEYVTQINDIINSTSTTPQPPTTITGPATAGWTGGLDLSSLLGTFNPAGAVPPSSSAPLTAAHLQQALAHTVPPQPQVPPPRLEDILTTEAILNSGVLDDPQIRHEALLQLPEDQQVDHLIEENIRSAQFQQSLEALSDALMSDSSAVFGSFGVDPAPGAAELLRGDGVGSFLTSLQAAATVRPNEPSAATPVPTVSEPQPQPDESKDNDNDNDPSTKMEE